MYGAGCTVAGPLQLSITVPSVGLRCGPGYDWFARESYALPQHDPSLPCARLEAHPFGCQNEILPTSGEYLCGSPANTRGPILTGGINHAVAHPDVQSSLVSFTFEPFHVWRRSTPSYATHFPFLRFEQTMEIWIFNLSSPCAGLIRPSAYELRAWLHNGILQLKEPRRFFALTCAA